MSIAYVVVTILAALMVGFSAFSAFTRAKWIVQPLAAYGIPDAWVPWLGTAKTAGAVGLLVGLFVPVIGVLAGICLVVYFAAAVITVVHAHVYAHVLFPLIYVAPVIAALVLRSAA
ncbi:MAG TPA: DoxX family protein [Ktedonobacterales bacterium]